METVFGLIKDDKLRNSINSNMTNKDLLSVLLQSTIILFYVQNICKSSPLLEEGSYNVWQRTTLDFGEFLLNDYSYLHMRS